MNAENKVQVIPEQAERSEKTAVSPPGTQAILPHVPGELSDQELAGVAGGTTAEEAWAIWQKHLATPEAQARGVMNYIGQHYVDWLQRSRGPWNG